MSLLGGGGGLPGNAGGSSQFPLGTNAPAANNMLFQGRVLGGPNASNLGTMGDGASADFKNISLQMQMAALINVQQMYAAQMAQMASMANPPNPNVNPAALNGAFPGMKNPLSMPQMQEYDERELEGMGDRRGMHGSQGFQGLDRQRKKMGEQPVGSPVNRRLQRGRRGGRQDDYLGYGVRRAGNVGIIGIPETIQSRSPVLEMFRATSASVGRSAVAADAASGMLSMNSGVGPREWRLGELKGHIVEFATDQHGSRFIQQQLEVASPEEVQIVLTETLEDVQILMMDVFGNYVVQKLLEYGGKQALRLIAAELNGRMLVLSLHMYGCRVVQKVLEVLDNEARGSLVRELDSHILKCIHDQNGNHVIQKCVQLVDPTGMQFIVDAVIDQAVTLAEHSYGCRVVQRILEHGAQEQKAPIMKEIMRSIEHLINDQYGNYVIQHVVEHGTRYERDAIIDIARKNIFVLSQHKFASNVVERCLQHGSIEQRRELIEMFIVGPEGPPNPSPLGSLVRDQYGNYVVQRILDIAEPGQRMRVVDILRDQVSAIKKYSYGKHIVARLEH
uniref:PUM-HD domain-containing protein n=1 Tax=Rhodosorus marinus TaxID=101924 RepID=A0A7S0BSH7_9RHOD